MGVKIRLYNPTWKSPAITDLHRLDVHGKANTYFEIFYFGTASATATELGGAANSIGDGTTTPLQLSIVSAQVTDIDTGAGKVRKVRIIGVSVPTLVTPVSEAVYSVEEINMNGTTDVLSSRWYLRLIHVYSSDWGSGGQDAEGDITIENPADTDLQTITAGTNESSGCVIYGCNGYRGRWNLLDISHQDPDFNNV